MKKLLLAMYGDPKHITTHAFDLNDFRVSQLEILDTLTLVQKGLTASNGYKYSIYKGVTGTYEVYQSDRSVKKIS